ncbi:TlpA disulfide reductase family protein [Flavisolibacter tropicus]|uniref:TlpA disulfide reductase family protein n=1 Tax=Flavisolibacter tropicus TaxID=1492898 RepID=UPI00082CE8C1|nr:TlpA disulfide reductase family protein [Flavisolibacter tropicus]
MKRIKWLCTLASLLVFQGQLLATEINCAVNGQINGLGKDVTLTVVQRSGEHGSQTVKTTKTKEKGEFSFTLPATLFNQMLEIRVEGVRYAISFFAEKGMVQITSDKNKLYVADIKGTAENERWDAYQKYALAITLKRNSLNMNMGSTSKEERIRLFTELDAQQKHFEDSIIQHYPNSVVALYLAKVPLPMLKYYQIDSLLTHFKPYFATHNYYLAMKKQADVLRKVAPGAMAPDFTVVQPDGVTKISLSSLRGKYVMLDFWASWCVPCRAENVHTKELYEKYHPYGLEILSFSLDSDRDAWKKAVEKDGLVWHNASDLVGGKLSPVAQKYGIDGLPAVWIIDPKGKIVAEGVRGESLDKLLSSLFVH